MILRLTIFIFLLSPLELLSQVRSSQFYSTPLLYNPAATGKFNKLCRVSISSRSEINGPKSDFSQNIISVDKKFFSKKFSENDFFSFGIVGVSEKGLSEGIKNSQLSFSLAFHKSLDEAGLFQLGIGFQNSIIHRSIQKPDLTFESDLLLLSNYGYTNLDIFQFQNADFTFHDLNVGILFQGAINDKTFYSLGISGYHVTSPKISIVEGTYNLERQIFSHASFEKSFRDKKKVYLSIIYGFTKQRHDELITATNYEIEVKGKVSLNLGLGFRKSFLYGNSIIPSFGMIFKDVRVNFSQDIKTSKILNQNKANELTLVYTIAKTKNQYLEKRFIKF